ncbi:MAG TPA: TonB family protein [Verrucomicrobiae bacterium]|nr:TonB family protein [Verrucomicrobiae bacterium]
MAPLIKDTLDLATPASESTHTSRESAAPPQLRGDALSLEVHVKVHGSRVTEVGRGLPPRTEPFEEQTSTMIVFPQGAVLRLTTSVTAGQMLVLTNLKTRQDAICRVVKVRANGQLSAYVEVEFTSRQTGYWGVSFPGEALAASPVAASRPPASPAPAAPPATQSLRPAAVPPAPPKSAPPVPAQNLSAATVVPPAPVKPPLPTSAFTSFGTQEKVQAAASEIVKNVSPASQPKSAAPAAPVSEPPLDEAKLTAAIGTVKSSNPPAPLPSLSLEDLIGDTDTRVLSDSAASSSATPAESHTLGISAPDTPETSELTSSAYSDRPMFGARLDSSLSGSASSPDGSHRNWFLVAACVGGLFVAGAGGYFFFRPHTPLHVSAAAPAASQVSQNPLPDPPADTSVTGVPITASTVGAGSTTIASAQPVAPARTNPGVAPPSGSVPASTEPVVHFQPAPKPAVTTAMVTETLDSHPIAAQHTGEVATTEAPTVDSSAAISASGAALPGSVSAPSSISIPTPSLRPDGPVKVGGEVKEPHLVFAPPPIYPENALEVNVQGDVVIQAVIDKKGSVADAHVVSGPIMLRQAALAALRRWKYQPSTLDGQPVSVQMLVTIRFHHQ